MGKEATVYLTADPFKIIEEGFHPERSKVSESIFSLANEYSGVRGYFDEGSSLLPTLRGSYFNGIYDYSKKDTPSAYLGIVKRTHFMLDAVDWLKCRLVCRGQTLDLGISKFHGFIRELDLKSGLLTRRFVWEVEPGENITVEFRRFLAMEECHKGFQIITLTADFEGEVLLDLTLDSNVLQWGQDSFWQAQSADISADEIHSLAVQTLTTKQKVVSAMRIGGDVERIQSTIGDKFVTYHGRVTLVPHVQKKVCRYVANCIDKFGTETFEQLGAAAAAEARAAFSKGYEAYWLDNKIYWSEVWKRSDIEIEGSLKDQQGIRFGIFQLEQTYHGFDPTDNIGAKGLTGEAYSGHAFWDSETYCLPYYLFHNPEAARSLLVYRYNTLPQARERAKALDCEGACYPIATLNGEEGCNLWQHASLQLQPSTAVAYGIFHYCRLTDDTEFMEKYGLTMLLEICRFLYSRGQWDQHRRYFGYYGVMGPDEFQLMVNHNAYTNYMAKQTFEYTLKTATDPRFKETFARLTVELGLSEQFLTQIEKAAARMKINYDSESGLFEQHEGFFDLPHIDVDSIPVSDFPLYSHWSYDRIYRNDMIKQPDVLMFLFLYSSCFGRKEKKANYDYYEPRTIHESSLSPSIHSIFATELGYEKAALDFFAFATRLDLDDYNRNTSEGLHLTSLAAVFMNIVYGFGGLRSDGSMLELAPVLPSIWKAYRFTLLYRKSLLQIDVRPHEVRITNEGAPVTVKLYGKPTELNGTVKVSRP